MPKLTITKWLYDSNNVHRDDIYTILYTENENYNIKPQTRVDLLIDLFKTVDDFPEELDIDPTKLKYDIAGRKAKKAEYTPNEELINRLLANSTQKKTKEAKAKIKKNVKTEDIEGGKIYYYENSNGKTTKITRKFKKSSESLEDSTESKTKKTKTPKNIISKKITSSSDNDTSDSNLSDY